MRLTDTQQAILMWLALVLPPIAVWAANGFPGDRMSLGFLASAIISGTLVFIKEYLGAS